MESEQYMKLVEDIRVQLAKGSYMLDGDDLPFHGKAEVIANHLWVNGYRPQLAKSVMYRQLHLETESAWIQLWALKGSLESRMNSIAPDHEEYAGLRYALEEVQSRFETVNRKRDYWFKMETEALKEEGYSD